MTEYDYIIVGAGTAGCVLAARLSEDRAAQVLLLEAGSSRVSRTMTMPDAWPDLLGTAADWGDVTTAQADAGPVPYPRGRALGGSGAINAMAHIRGHRAVYDAWAAGGAHGWGYEDLLPYFCGSERTAGRHPVLRGTAGPVGVAPVPEPARHPVAVAFAAALAQAGCPVTADLSGQYQEGTAWADLAIDDGQRVSPASVYLTAARSRPNLTIQAGCLVTGLQVRHGQCVGVSYLHDGVPDLARCTGEVIVCAGAVGTPQLLMLSGIGPAAQLRALGIEAVADLPGVGENLQDHPVVLVCYASPGPLPRSRYNHGEVYAALRSPLADAWPDLHLFPILLPAAPTGCQPPPAGYALAVAVIAPDSRGTVRLAAADPLAGPVINPGFLRDLRDLDRLETGLAMIRQAAASPALALVRAAEIAPGLGIRANALVRAWIRGTVTSYYHPAGTCRIGADTDPGTVVDAELRVRWITGLRIADASVIPLIPNAPLHATVLAIAEKAADLIASR